VTFLRVALALVAAAALPASAQPYPSKPVKPFLGVK